MIWLVVGEAGAGKSAFIDGMQRRMHLSPASLVFVISPDDEGAAEQGDYERYACEAIERYSRQQTLFVEWRLSAGAPVPASILRAADRVVHVSTTIPKR